MWTSFPLHSLLLVTLLTCAQAATDNLYRAHSFFTGDCSNPGIINEFVMEPQSRCSPGTFCDASGQNMLQQHCNISSPDTHARMVFGSTAQYITFRYFSDDACTKQEFVRGRRLSGGNCFTVDSISSISYSVRTDTIVQAKTFGTTNCSGPVSSVEQYARDDVRSHKCIGKMKLYVETPVNLSPQAHTTEIFFTDAQCTIPNRVLIKPKEAFVTHTEGSCTKTAGDLFYKREKYVTIDPSTKAAEIFGSRPVYVLEQSFYDVNCTKANQVSVYRADNSCVSLGTDTQTSTRVFLDVDGTYTRDQFAGTGCNGGVLETVRLDKDNMNNGSCVGGRKAYTHTAGTPLATKATTPTQNNRPSSAALKSVAAFVMLTATVGAAYISYGG